MPKSGQDVKARDVLTSVGEAVYEWRANGDRLRWSNNALDVLHADILSIFPNGKAYTDLITQDTLTARYRAIFASGRSDDGSGVPFECIYCLAPRGFDDELRLWVEENGRWFADDNGRAACIHGVVRVVNEQQHREQRLRFLSQFDQLTGLYNRSHFFDQLQQAIEAFAEAGKEACVLVAQLDNFRVVNESYGFETADQVICEVARRLSHRLRDGDLVGRISGTKFGLLINNCSEKEMEAAAGRFLDAAREELIATDAGPVHVTLSIGGVNLGEHVQTHRAAEICALDALDRAKLQGRGSFFSLNDQPFVWQEREERIKMADEVISALNDRRIALAYQPVVDAGTGLVAFHEALLRVDDRTGNPIEAASFVDYAVELGLAELLDHRVLEMALDLLFNHPDARLSINVSKSVPSNGEWLSYLRARIANYPDVADRLIIEFSEVHILSNEEKVVAFFDAVKALKVRLAVDDFAAAATSFQLLQKLPADMVKMAGGLVHDIVENKQNRAIVHMFTALADELGLAVVAKWVVSAEVADLLGPLKISYFQGYHFGKPDKTNPWLDGPGQAEQKS